MINLPLHESTKSLFKKLLKFFEESTDSVVILTRAFSISNIIHMGRFYNSIKSEPYINHPLRVALIMAGELNIKDKHVIAAAILHDIFDKKYANQTQDNLNNVIEEQTLNLVLSFMKYDVKDMEADQYHRLLLKSSKIVRYLILCDRLDNIRTLKQSPYSDRVRRYKQETQNYFLPVANSTDDNLVFKLSVALYELK